eukprot:UN25287
MHPICVNGKFETKGFTSAKQHAVERQKKQKERGKFVPKYVKKQNPLIQLVKHLGKIKQLPVVVFCFSRKGCEREMDKLKQTELLTKTDAQKVRTVIYTALKRLHGADRRLPQILRMLEFLQRGVGVHHAGLLPIVKEFIEILFGQGLVKVLFATETFAMGVNMPAKTVVFENLQKHDGRSFRDLKPEEYTQMAGRAGRRGIDKFGMVIINCRFQKIPEVVTVQKMIQGSPTRLQSKFRLTYNMILNLLRVEEIKVEDMIKRSFGEFHSQKLLPQKKQIINQLEKQINESKRNILYI